MASTALYETPGRWADISGRRGSTWPCRVWRPIRLCIS